MSRCQLDAMPKCEYCGESTTRLTYKCSYCDQMLCQSHRLPETHDCPNLANARPPTSLGQTANADVDLSRGMDKSLPEIDKPELRKRAEAEAEGQPYSVAEVQHTVGTKPEPNYEPTPDVAVDGSIKREEGAGAVTNQTDKSDDEGIPLRIVMAVSVVTAIIILVLFVI